MVNQLPQGWKEEELGKLADVIAGQSPEGIYYNTVGDERLFIKESLNSKKCIWESQQNGLQKLQNWQKEMTF